MLAVSMGTFFHWYGVMTLLGVVLQLVYSCFLLQMYKVKCIHAVNFSTFYLMYMFALLVVMMGSKMGNLLFYELPLSGSALSFDVVFNRAGFAFFGGFMAFLLVVIFYRSMNLPAVLFMDIVGMGVPIVLFLGRIANYIGGDIPGIAVTIPFLSHYVGATHPVALYEAGVCMLIFIMQMYFVSKDFVRVPGKHFAFSCILYGVSSFFLEFLRVEYLQSPWSISVGHMLSFIMVIFGFFLLNNCWCCKMKE